MGILDQITQMQNQGIPNEDIVRNLQEQGISPKEINDALSQAQIKSAVSSEQYGVPSPEGMYSPSTQEANPQQQEYSQGYYQEPYAQQTGYAQQSMQGGTDTMIEVAEQVFNEKMKKIQTQLDKLNEFQTLAQAKIETNTQRLKKLESTIDQLQAAILKKIGSYGGTLDTIKDEMSMMQDSFSKMVEHKVKEHKKK